MESQVKFGSPQNISGVSRLVRRNTKSPEAPRSQINLMWHYYIPTDAPTSDKVCTNTFSFSSYSEDSGFKIGVSNVFLNQFAILELPETCRWDDARQAYILEQFPSI